MPAWLAFAIGAVVLGTIYELVVGVRRSSSNPPTWIWSPLIPLRGALFVEASSLPSGVHCSWSSRLSILASVRRLVSCGCWDLALACSY